MMTVTVLMVLVFSAVFTAPAFADDSTPPPVDTPTEVSPPPADEPAVADAPAVVDAPPAEVAAPAVEPVQSNATVAELLAQVPEGTDLIVTDSNGEALPLASTEAADAIEFVDPVWCPTGVTPNAGIGGCSGSFANLALLVTGFVPSGNGTIWIQSGVDGSVAGTPIIIDGAGTWAAAKDFSLALTGGWSGAMGSGAIDPAAPSIFDQRLSIINWNAAVSLSDIEVIGAQSNGAQPDSALLIETTGNIQLNRVTVKNGLNAGAGEMTGATLDNQTSPASSSVSVNNGIFENNEGDGLSIFSAGVVTITSLFANGNDQGGAIIDNSSAAADLAVTLQGSQEYNNNGGGPGLWVTSNGFVTISNVIANANAGNGVDIDNSASFTAQGVTVSGTNMFNDNSTGLNILSHGMITTYNIFASDNGADGVHLDNCDGTDCSVLGTPSVNLLGKNYFYNNTEDGLDVRTFGDIIAYDLTASYNHGHGARLDNKLFNNDPTTPLESYGTITLYGYNVFNNNGDDGLNVTSSGDFVSYNLTANDNTNDGVSLTLNKTQTSLQPYTYAYRVKKGKKYITAYATGYRPIDNANITLYGVNNFVNNSSGDGLNASADGSITLYTVNSNFNGDEGAELHTTTDGFAITLYGPNSFTNNDGMGLLVTSLGAITLSNVTANDNTGTGVDLDNRASSTGQAVIINGTNMFNGNAAGLKVLSHGEITTNNTFASDNSLGDGVHLDNCHDVSGCTAPGAPNVNLLGVNYFSNNFGDGLDVTTFGNITSYNLTASNNTANGALLNNQKVSAVGAIESVGTITLNGSNVFNFNTLDGLNATSSNDFVAYSLTANLNGDDGVSLTVNKTQLGYQAYTYAYRAKVGKK